MKNKYQLLNENIREVLVSSNKIDYTEKSYIELLYQHAFLNDFFLQILWDRATVEWYRTTWLQDKDRESVNKWSNHFERDNDELTITLNKEQGYASIDRMNGILSTIDALVIRPVYSNESRGRDGAIVRLTIGEKNISSVFSWITCDTPQDWESLDSFVELLLRIVNEFKAEKNEVSTISWSINHTPQMYSKLILLEKKEH